MSLTAAENVQYSRHLLLDEVGRVGQLKLSEAKVLVIGAGGLGCPVLQYLAAAGVGRIGIVDNDVVDQSNLQRQILYTHEDIGKSKAKIAAKRLRSLNPFIQFDIHITRLSKHNVFELFTPYTIIVDGTDNFPTRYLINDAAVILDKTVVFGAIHKFTGQIAVFNFKQGPTYRCLFPSPPAPDEVPNCSEIGVLGVLPGIIGCLQANEVLKLILGLGDVLSGQLLTFDALSMKKFILAFKKDTSLVITALDDDYEIFCGIDKSIHEIDFQEYQEQAENYNLLDVRTQKERDEFHIKSIHIPLDELSERYHEIANDKNLLVYCKSGIRSKLAIKILQNKGFNRSLTSLKGGLSVEKIQ